MYGIEGESVKEEAEEQRRVDRRPRSSQPRLQQRNGVHSATQNARRKTEVFVVRARQGKKGRHEERQSRERIEERESVEEGGRNPSRRRGRREAGWKQRDRDCGSREEEVKDTLADGSSNNRGRKEKRHGRNQERQEIRDENVEENSRSDRRETSKAGLKKRGEKEEGKRTDSKEGDGGASRTSSRQGHYSTAKSRERPREVLKDWREEEMKDEVSLQGEATPLQSHDPEEQESTMPQKLTRREKRDPQGIRKRNDEQSIENHVHAPSDQENSNASREREGARWKRRQDNRRGIDRNWRDKLEESGEKKPAERAPPSSAVKRDESTKTVPENSVPDKKGEGERKKNKKASQSMPKKASHSKGEISNHLPQVEPVYRNGPLQ